MLFTEAWLPVRYAYIPVWLIVTKFTSQNRHRKSCSIKTSMTNVQTNLYN